MPFKDMPPLYTVWQSMRARCLNPNSKPWPDYGGRGIKICDEWSDYKTFERDMMPRPPGTSIERKDNDGNYEPSNCRWATKKEQQRNQRTTRLVTIEGITYKVAELAERFSIKGDIIIERSSRGMTFNEVTSPNRYFSKTSWRAAVAVRVANQVARTHCKHGHEFTPENTYRSNKNNTRHCRHCARLKMARLNKAKRVAISQVLTQ